ncbi:hypothetical protein REPUB_Repub11eG0077900 [Reevesia pubescens]
MGAMSWPTQDEVKAGSLVFFISESEFPFLLTFPFFALPTVVLYLLQSNKIRKIVSEMAGKCTEDVRVVVSPYRICPLGAHVDHQGGIVSAMTINKGILLGFVPSGDTQVALRSGQFTGEVRFRVNETQQPRHTISQSEKIKVDNSSPSPEECEWGTYARGALYALQSRGNHLAQVRVISLCFRGIIGYICGSEGLDSSGLSSSAARKEKKRKAHALTSLLLSNPS